MKSEQNKIYRRRKPRGIYTTMTKIKTEGRNEKSFLGEDLTLKEGTESNVEQSKITL